MEEEKRKSGETPRAHGKIVMATVKGDVHDVVSSLLNPGLKSQFDAANRADQQRVREPHSALKRRPMLPAASVSGL